MGDHLVSDFAELPAQTVLDQVARARYAVTWFGLAAEEQLEIAELVARHQLSLMCGRVEDAARLDPQPHPKRGLVGRLD